MDADEAVRAASMIPKTELAAAAGLPLDPSGRIRVDGALRSPACPEVYGAGDAPAASSPRAGALRMACATAMPMGSCAASSNHLGDPWAGAAAAGRPLPGSVREPRPPGRPRPVRPPRRQPARPLSDGTSGSPGQGAGRPLHRRTAPADRPPSVGRPADAGKS
ncbi:hypothetical protein [Streptomyces sp. NPDC007988]|uniref:hypothetical protein n=1 Tax=Streptomyces sp. NPDC007988 TaxID=3364802 RepID=UPI0036E7C0C0